MGTRAQLQDLLGLLTATGTRPVIDSRYDFDDDVAVREAFERLHAGEAFGKVVLTRQEWDRAGRRHPGAGRTRGSPSHAVLTCSDDVQVALRRRLGWSLGAAALNIRRIGGPIPLQNRDLSLP